MLQGVADPALPKAKRVEQTKNKEQSFLRVTWKSIMNNKFYMRFINASSVSNVDELKIGVYYLKAATEM